MDEIEAQTVPQNEQEPQDVLTDHQSSTVQVENSVEQLPVPSNSQASTDSHESTSLPGYLPWEKDMEMVSKYLDRKVCTIEHTTI